MFYSVTLWDWALNLWDLSGVQKEPTMCLGGVDQRSSAPIWYHQKFQVWNVVKKKTLFTTNNSIVIEHSCENSTALERSWGQAPVWLDSSVVLPHGLLCSYETSSVFQLQLQPGKHRLQSLVERESMFPECEKNWLIQPEGPAPGAWLVCPHINEDSKSLQFDWSKKHCVIA